MGTGELVTVKVFSYPHELAIVKGRLEADGIECFVKDENMVQVNPIYSNAVGGVKLQVRESDMQQAIAILLETGHLDYKKQPHTKAYTRFDAVTSKIPYLKKLGVEVRVYVLIALFTIVFVPLLFFGMQPSTYETLTKTTWCVDYVSYDGKVYEPYSLGIRMEGSGFCNENIKLSESGSVRLPGFHTMGTKGTWLYNNKQLCLQADTFAFIYNKCFEVAITDNNTQLVLTNGITQIHCHAQRIDIHLPF